MYPFTIYIFDYYESENTIGWPACSLQSLEGEGEGGKQVCKAHKDQGKESQKEVIIFFICSVQQNQVKIMIGQIFAICQIPMVTEAVDWK